MNRVCLLAVVSALALCAQESVAAERISTSFPGARQSGKAPKGAQLLYSQNSNDAGWSVNSQNFTSGSLTSAGDAGADDFVVPKKSHWRVTEVDVTGYYFNGSGGGSENVIFYQDNNGKPGEAVKKGTFTGLVGNANDGSFAITLPGHGLSLKPGTYWVSVVANCSFVGGCGEWNWEVSSVIHGNQAVWEQPGSTGNCQTWGTLDTCFGTSGDFMFDLRGKTNRE